LWYVSDKLPTHGDLLARNRDFHTPSELEACKCDVAETGDGECDDVMKYLE